MTLKLQNVSYSTRGTALLDDVSFEIHPGEIVTIIGPNGAGKSTLLRVASGLLPASAGAVTLDSLPIDQLSPERLALRRAMLSQETSAQVRFTVEDIAGMSVHHLPRQRRLSLVAAQLQRVGLGAFAQREITSLSGGERQRAHLARVLVQLEAGLQHGQPGLLLLDEPISAQDPARQEQILELARDHTKRGGTCLIVLHDLNWAAACSDHIIVLNAGRIHLQGAACHVLTPEMLKDVFGLKSPRVRTHTATQRPFIIPHDVHFTAPHIGEKPPCTSQ
ncbi:heme ABC transporter ATP-binding protein [Neokomagataea tanensis]|uniref:Heme ABC transporter ATP-binding protein n=1 Tax=Neokomagataea tanensis TaxID=661191 RepID=A0A4Y6V955_9PROT|nr:MULTISPECIES: heme ABC transporter ATP-binding protein [Neokomagataea]QDH24905.1 heme ABC transporter ATP-binding protein [Neokomagataea tanensis]